MALLSAIHANDLRQFQLILGANGLPPCPGDFELLEISMIYGYTNMAQLLIDRGCTVDVAEYRGISTLHLSIINQCSYNFVQSLLISGAVISRFDFRGDTALHLAFKYSVDEKIVDLLLRTHLTNSLRNVSNEHGLTYLHIAASRPHTEFIKCLVEQGMADVNCQIHADADTFYAGYTSLHMAVEFGRVDVVASLLNYGANLYAKDVNESTPLHLALERRREDLIELLFSYDLQRVNHVNRFGLTHFMAACACKKPFVMCAFLDNLANGKDKININEVIDNSPHYSFKGYTALHVAVEYGCIYTVRLLLANGAQPTLTYQGLPLTRVANKNEFRYIAQLLEMHEQNYE